MLVLTRKANEQILIGDDIKITLVRIRGNCVRVGIEAPRAVRVVRGELAERESDQGAELEFELEERETVFAHPQEQIGRHAKSTKSTKSTKSETENRLPEPFPVQSDSMEERPQIFVGRIRTSSRDDRFGRAPLAGFVAAT